MLGHYKGTYQEEIPAIIRKSIMFYDEFTDFVLGKILKELSISHTSVGNTSRIIYDANSSFASSRRIGDVNSSFASSAHSMVSMNIITPKASERSEPEWTNRSELKLSHLQDEPKSRRVAIRALP